MEINVKELMNKDIKDEVIIFQTDTVYGIGCKLQSEAGVNKIYEIKKRDGIKPLAVLCANMNQVKSLVKDFKTGEKHGLEHWPGALTLIFDKLDNVPDYVTSGFETVGVRIPNDEIALQILDKFGPMAVTSLNISTEPAILKYEETLKFIGQVDYIVKGENLYNLSSTVYDVRNKKTLRQGDIYINE